MWQKLCVVTQRFLLLKSSLRGRPGDARQQRYVPYSRTVRSGARDTLDYPRKKKGMEELSHVSEQCAGAL